MMERELEQAIRDLAEAGVDFSQIEVGLCEDGHSLMLKAPDQRGQWQAAGFHPGPRNLATAVQAMFAGEPPG